MSSVKEECGIFGIAAPVGSSIDPAYTTYLGLFSLQHRGQEAAGIAVNDRGVITCQKGKGLLTDVFSEEMISKMKGDSAIGHVRYSTTGESDLKNAQPISVSHVKGNMAIAHNGNLINARELRSKIENDGGLFHTSSDSEIIAYEIVRKRIKTGKIEEAVKGAMKTLKGAYSILVMSPKKVIAARDPNGFRPLVIGKVGKNYIFASETCAIDIVGGTFIRDVLPGEIVVCENNKLRSSFVDKKINMRTCSFEYIYFSRPDSVFQGLSIDVARKEMGRALARTRKIDADIVMPVPDSGIAAANGYAMESGIPIGTGLIKNRYVARTFISPTQIMREKQVKLKLNPLKETIKGKRVIIIDDSIVRGTTSKKLVEELRHVGVKEVHMAISSPPFRHPCYFGTDVPDTKKLIAYNRDEHQIAKEIGVDSIVYLPIKELRKILNNYGIGICDGCFSGKYPLLPPKNYDKNEFEEKLI